jgi:predicted O-methyltransferase YrrM
MTWWKDFKGQPGEPNYADVYDNWPDHWFKMGLQFSTQWFLRHMKTWDEFVKPWLKSFGPMHALEIGAYEGASTCWILENLPDMSGLTSIDPHYEGWENWNSTLRANVTKFINPRITFNGNGLLSQELLPVYAKLKNLYPFIYIDGSHTYEDVYFDVTHCLELLAPGGMMLIDDYWHPESTEGHRKVMPDVRKAIDQAFAENGITVKRLGQCVCHFGE